VFFGLPENPCFNTRGRHVTSLCLAITLIFITVLMFIYTVSDIIDKLVSLDKDTATFKLDVILGGLEYLNETTIQFFNPVWRECVLKFLERVVHDVESGKLSVSQSTYERLESALKRVRYLRDAPYSPEVGEIVNQYVNEMPVIKEGFQRLLSNLNSQLNDPNYVVDANALELITMFAFTGTVPDEEKEGLLEFVKKASSDTSRVRRPEE
jgi:hypothetical protein